MYVWKNLHELHKQITLAETLLIFLDYDGTIVPIASTPQEVKLPKKTKTLLEDIKRQRTIHLSIVSGRSLEDIIKQVSIPKIFYAGNHGLEWELNGKKYILQNMNTYFKHLSTIKKSLMHLEDKYPGVVVEDKRLTLAIHYRLVSPKHELSLHTYFNSIIQPSRDALPIRVSKGKKIYEIKPSAHWTKGSFVKFAINKLTKKYSNHIALYIGDDTTDEDVFSTLPNIISIKVGRGPTKAKYYLKNHQETIQFLRWILDTKKETDSPVRNPA